MGVNGIYGLSGSGLDIESMVKVGMMSKQNEYDKMQQKYTSNEWKKAEYLDLYGQVQTFSVSTLSQYKMSNTMNARGASSSNEATVSATANATAPNMTHYVEVGQLASAAYLIGTAQLKAQNTGSTSSTQLAEALFTQFSSQTVKSSDPNGTLTTTDNGDGTTTTTLAKTDGSTVTTTTNSDGSAETIITDTKGNLSKKTEQDSSGNVTVSNYVKGNWVVDSSSKTMITASEEYKFVTGEEEQITYYDEDGKKNIVDGDTVAFSFSVGDGGSGDELVSNNEDLFNISVSTNVSLTESHTVEVTQAIERAKVSGTATNLNGTQDVSRLFGKMFGVDSDEFANAMSRLATYKGDEATETAFSFTLGTDTGNTGTINITYADLASDVSISDFVKNLNSKISAAISDATEDDLKNSLRKVQAEFKNGQLSFVSTQYGSDSTLAFKISTADNFAIPSAPATISSTGMVDMTTSTKLIEFMGYTGQTYSGSTNLEFSYTVNDGYNSSNNVSSSISMAFSDIGTLTVSEFIEKLNEKFADAGADITAEYVQTSDRESGTIQFSTSYVGGSSSLSFSVSSSSASLKFASALFGIDNGEYSATQSGSDGDTETALSSLADFFGVTSENNYSTTDSGQVGTVLIDAEEYELTDNNSITLRATGDGRITYTFVDGATGTGTVQNVGPSNTIDVTYSQLANGYTFNDLVSNINSLGTNVRATYDSVQDRFSIYNKESGSSNQIILKMNEDDSGASRAAEFFNRMKLAQSENGNLSATSSEYAALSAEELSNIQEAGGGVNTYTYNEETGEYEYYATISGDVTTDNNLFTAENEVATTATEVDGEYKQLYILNEIDETYTFSTGKFSVISGTNAIVKIDGVDYTDLDANTATVNGVIYKFNAVTSSLTEDGKVDSTSGSKITVSVTQDTDAIVDKVKSFVDDYNALLKKLYEWYDQKPNSDYKPLTESQKSSMKDEQIEKWEAKAKEGLLYHDRTLGKIIDELRDAVGERIEGLTGSYNTIYSIGISTSGTKGQLTLDEDKLRAAIAEDPDVVYNIFAKLDKDDQYSNNGIAQRIGDVLSQGMKSIKSVSGSTADITEDSDLNNLLRELQTKMSNFKKMMAAFEEKLFKKYDAMESSLALLGAQLNYVTGAFSQ